MEPKQIPKVYLKLRYGNNIRILGCKASRSYDDIVHSAMKMFSIPKQFRGGLYITDVSGYVFHPDVFENYLLLFPKPGITFIIRIKEIQTCRDRPYVGKIKHIRRLRVPAKGKRIKGPQKVNWEPVESPNTA